jgi:hypothetical protein
MNSKIGILIFIMFFLIFQVRNAYNLYKNRNLQNKKFYINLVATIISFLFSIFVLYYYVYK